MSPLSAIVLQCGGQGTPDTADHIAKFVSDWQTCNGNGYKVTPNGLCIAPLGGWGDLRYATSAAFGMLLQAKCEADPAKRAAAVAWAKSQVDYALGSTGRSFVVGYGNNYPLKAHHRAASCPDMPATCDFSAFNSPLPNPQILSGAVVGGPPGPGDNYVDDRTNYQTNEVAVDFNAGFTGALAGLLAFQNGTVSAPSAVTKAGQEGLLLAPEMAPSVESVCDDVAPDSSATCAQQASYGKCGEAWMQGAVCRKSCGRC